MRENNQDIGAQAAQRAEEASRAAQLAEMRRQRDEMRAREAAEAESVDAAPPDPESSETRPADAPPRARTGGINETGFGRVFNALGDSGLARSVQPVGRDLAQLPGELAPAIWNGVAGAANETIDLAYTVGEQVGQFMEDNAGVFGQIDPRITFVNPDTGDFQLGAVFTRDGVRDFMERAGAKEEEDLAPQVPMAQQPDSVSGQAVQGITQFLTGFFAAGKMTQTAGILQGASKGARFGRAMLNGIIADFAVFDGHEARLADMILASEVELPEFAQAATEFLAVNEEDPELVGRMKNAIEGAGLGVVADTLITGLRAMKGARRVREETGNIQAEEAAADEIAREDITANILSRGDPDGPVVEVAARDVIDIAAEAPIEEPITRGGRLTRRVVEQRVEELRTGQAALEPAQVDQIVMRADAWAESVSRLQPRQSLGLQDRINRLREDASPEHVEALVDQIAQVRKGVEEPQSLLRFLRANGGVKDPSGELRAMDGGRVNLVNNKGGLDPDEMTLRAWEAGYLGDPMAAGGARPTPDEMYELIRREMGGEKVYSANDLNSVLEMAALRDLENELEHMGAPYTSRSQREHREWAQDVAERAPSEPLTFRDFEAARREEDAAGAGGGIRANEDGTFDIGGNRVRLNFNALKTADDVRSILGQIADQFSGEVNAARGYRSDSSIIAKAGRTDAWRALEERRGGSPLSDSETLAAQSLYVASAENLNRAIRDAGTGGDLGQYNLRRAMAVHRAVQAEIAGAKADAARALRAWAIPRGASAQARREMEQVLQRYGGAINQRDLGRLREMAPGKLDDASRVLTGAQHTAEVLAEVIRFMWLSGPQTHLMNLAGNALTMTYDVGVRMGSGAYGKLIGDAELADEFGAAMAEYAGLRAGISAQIRTFIRSADYGRMSRRLYDASDRSTSFREFLQQSAAAVWEDNPVAATGRARFDDMGVAGRKFDDLPADRAVSAERFGMRSGTAGGDMLNGMGTILSAPTDFLAWQDDFFKGSNFVAAMHRQAYQRAMTDVRAGVLTKDQAQGRMRDLLTDPDQAMIEEATATAQRRTFTEPVGVGTRSALKLRQWANGLGMPFGHLLLPFVTTPSNILKFGFQNSPFGVLFREMRDELEAGGQRRAMAQARIATGSAMLFTAMDLAANGRITGAAPSEPGQRALWAREGIQEYSVRIGNRWVSYRRLEPVSTMIAIGADLQQRNGNRALAEHVDADTADVLGPSLGAFISIVHSKSYLTSLSEFFAFAEDPERHGANWLERMASGLMVPAAIGQFESSFDPEIRAAHSIVTRAQSRVPGWSERLPKAYDLWGRERMMQSGLGQFYDAVSPFSVRTYEPEPIDKALRGMAHYPNLPRPAMSVQTPEGSVPVNLQNQQDLYQRYVQLAGNGVKMFGGLGARDYLNAVVDGGHPDSAMWNQMHSDATRPGSRQQYVDRVIEQSRRAAQAELQRTEGRRLRELAAATLQAERRAGERAQEQAAQMQGALEGLAGDG